MGSEQKSPLYERLGGVYPIATVIDDFIDRVMNDARLNANPLVDEAHHRVTLAGFKYLATELVCSLSRVRPAAPPSMTCRPLLNSVFRLSSAYC